MGALVFNWVWLGLSKSKAARDDANAVNVTAVQLFADYQANAASADTTYKSAPLRVTGNLDRIGNDPDDAPYVTLITNSATRRVQAVFPESARDQLAHLYRRQWITVRCQGASVQSDVVLNHCRLESTP